MADFQIRDLERVLPNSGRSYWMARVVSSDGSLKVHNRYGSWLVQFDDVGLPLRELLPHVAKALQAKVIPLEKREKRERASVLA